MAKYIKTDDGNVVDKEAKPKFIPADPRNGDWIKFKKWEAKGNKPDNKKDN